MSQVRLAIRIVTWTIAVAWIGLRLLMLGFPLGPGEPPSGMTFEEFHIRSASGQWLRDDVDSFIIQVTFWVTALIIVTIATTQRKKSQPIEGKRNGAFRHNRVFWVFMKVAVVCLCLLACVVVQTRLGYRADYGGNIAALAACATVVTSLELISDERTNAPVTITNIIPSKFDYFGRLPGLELLPDCTVWVRPIAISSQVQPPGEIIAVCDKAFDNIPRRVFGKTPLTHAAAYADGSRALLSVEEFRRLDLSGLVDVRTVQNKKVEKAGAASGSQPIRSEINRTSSTIAPELGLWPDKSAAGARR